MSKNIREKQEEIKSELIRKALDELNHDHDIGSADVFKYLREKKSSEKIPVYIFRQGISPLQAAVKFLVENLFFRFNEIANLLNRDERTIWSTYNSVRIRYPGTIKEEYCEHYVDLDVFRDRNFSFLENLCMHLRERYSLRYCKIAEILGKDERTIWTACRRAELKRGKIEG